MLEICQILFSPLKAWLTAEARQFVLAARGPIKNTTHTGQCIVKDVQILDEWLHGALLYSDRRSRRGLIWRMTIGVIHWFTTIEPGSPSGIADKVDVFRHEREKLSSGITRWIFIPVVTDCSCMHTQQICHGSARIAIGTWTPVSSYCQDGSMKRYHRWGRKFTPRYVAYVRGPRKREEPKRRNRGALNVVKVPEFPIFDFVPFSSEKLPRYYPCNNFLSKEKTISCRCVQLRHFSLCILHSRKFD